MRSMDASAIFSTEFSYISASCGVNLVEISTSVAVTNLCFLGSNLEFLFGELFEEFVLLIIAQLVPFLEFHSLLEELFVTFVGCWVHVARPCAASLPRGPRSSC